MMAGVERSILDHLFSRLERPSEVLSMECDDAELWTALDWKIVVTMGMTGAGKSNFIAKARNTLQNDLIDIGSLDSQTSDIQAYKIHINGHKLILVDTPGFDDSHRSDLAILRVIANWLETTFRRKVLLDGVLYFHRITDNRMSGSAVSNIKIFQGLVGKGLVSRNVKFVTTMWEHDTKREGETRENELKKNPEYWGTMVNDGASVVRFLNSHESAKDILRSFRTGWHTQQALQLQVELVKQHRRLNETKAGQMLYEKLGELLTQHQQLLMEKRRDSDYQFSEDPEYRALMEELAKVRGSMKELHLGFGGRLHALFARWK
ncbi:hypothetical protein BJ165DRAFT_176848 [Panaeolus papilionaceus]|nr:hypothetical protein BJ165DRAFT_176848 [Panaeolus papilionaceus]